MVNAKRLGQDDGRRPCSHFNVAFYIRRLSFVEIPNEFPSMPFNAGDLVCARTLATAANVPDFVQPETDAYGVLTSQGNPWLEVPMLAKADMGGTALQFSITDRLEEEFDRGGHATCPLAHLCRANTRYFNASQVQGVDEMGVQRVVLDEFFVIKGRIQDDAPSASAASFSPPT